MSETPEAGVPRPSAERVFPPWSAGRIVFWIAVGVVVSIVFGAMIGVGVATVSIWLTGSMGEAMAPLAGFIEGVLQGFITFALIAYLLKRRGFSLIDAWGTSSGKLRQLAPIALAGIAYMSAVDLINRVFHLQPDTSLPLAGDWRLLGASELVISGVLIPFTEELVFRGLLYRAFRLRHSPFDAALFSSLIFALNHTQYLRAPYYLAEVFAVGLVCAFLLEHTRSLNAGITFHCTANVTTITTNYFINYLT